jgi:broad specificity phosphatase PhoE
LARCAAIKPNGERCRGDAMPGAEWCWSHHPDHAEQRRRQASRAGKSGGRGRPGVGLAQIRSRVVELAEDVLAGDADPRAAAVAGQLYNTALRARSVELQEREQLELVERLERLEQELELRERSNTWGA